MFSARNIYGAGSGFGGAPRKGSPMATRLRLFAVVFAAAVTLPAVAHADPVTAYVVGTMLSLTGTAAAVATFVVNAAIYAAGSFSADCAFGRKSEDDK
ncbi:hypothetical protein D3C86_1169750 [compost metagenome]